MAFCCSSGSTDPNSSKIDQTIKQAKKNQDAPVLLLLGAGNAGKSTFTKQLLHFNSIAPTQAECAEWISALHVNTLSSAKTLIAATLSHAKLKATLANIIPPAVQKKLLESEELEPFVDNIEALAVKEISDILEDLESEVTFLAGGHGAKHFFKNVRNYVKPGYVPTHEDIIHVRKKTNGIQEYHLKYDGKAVTIVDVGGQKSERRKWIDQFEKTTAIIFLVAINEYDLNMEEEVTENRLVDSIKMFRALSSSFLKDKPFILFLNKSDLFQKKIQKVPLASVFEGFEEFEKSEKCKDKFETSWKFLAEQFKSKFSGTNTLTVHLTSALDAESCKKVWSAVASNFLIASVAAAGLII
jgi:GTPase SAR1 family protein